MAITVSIIGAAPAQARNTGPGYAAPVTGALLIQHVQARFGDELSGLGIPADILGCRLMSQVAVGVRNSETTYGAACTIRIGGKPPAIFVICDRDLSGFGTLYSGGFVDRQDWIAAFIRKNCF